MQRQCPHCHGDLEPGFLFDQDDGIRSVRWIQGPFEKGLFGGPRLLGKPHFDVEAYRCTQCHRIELIALPQRERPQDD